MNCKLDFRKAEELKEYKFIVDFYQRGYRWSADDAKSLAIDIADYDGNYFLQPLVVKKLEDNIYELVDGQQRLTTLNLIMKAASGTESIQIEYKRNAGQEVGTNKVDKLFREAVAMKLSDLTTDQKEKLRKKIFEVYFVKLSLADVVQQGGNGNRLHPIRRKWNTFAAVPSKFVHAVLTHSVKEVQGV